MKRLFIVVVLAILVTYAFAKHQKRSGPTYPVAFSTEVAGSIISGELIRSGDINEDLQIVLEVPEDVEATLIWRRFPTRDEWTSTPFTRTGNMVSADLPKQGMAGKVEYTVAFSKNGQQVIVPEKTAAVARFKGSVPLAVLLVHIICMVLGMLFSNVAGFEGLSNGPYLKIFSRMAFGFLLLGGLILGPVVQKYAFDAYWTGWPLGGDWTDNKLAVGALAWLFAVWATRGAGINRPSGKWAAVLAMIVIFVVYGIPHSIHGSTLDYETGEHIQVMLQPLLDILT